MQDTSVWILKDPDHLLTEQTKQNCMTALQESGLFTILSTEDQQSMKLIKPQITITRASSFPNGSGMLCIHTDKAEVEDRMALSENNTRYHQAMKYQLIPAYKKDHDLDALVMKWIRLVIAVEQDMVEAVMIRHRENTEQERRYNLGRIQSKFDDSYRKLEEARKAELQLYQSVEKTQRKQLMRFRNLLFLVLGSITAVILLSALIPVLYAEEAVILIDAVILYGWLIYLPAHRAERQVDGR